LLLAVQLLMAVCIKELDRRLQRIVQQPTKYQTQRFVQDMLCESLTVFALSSSNHLQTVCTVPSY